MNDKELREKILELTAEWSRRNHSGLRPGYDSKKSEFIPGETPIPYAARTFTELEVVAAINTTLDFWLTLGKEGAAFERELAQFLGIRNSLLVNSGSSANLVMLQVLIETGRIKKGSNVVVPALAWATDLSPVVQLGLNPVLCDCNLEDLSIDLDHFEKLCRTSDISALMFVSVLGLVLPHHLPTLPQHQV